MDPRGRNIEQRTVTSRSPIHTLLFLRVHIPTCDELNILEDLVGDLLMTTKRCQDLEQEFCTDGQYRLRVAAERVSVFKSGAV